MKLIRQNAVATVGGCRTVPVPSGVCVRNIEYIGECDGRVLRHRSSCCPVKTCSKPHCRACRRGLFHQPAGDRRHSTHIFRVCCSHHARVFRPWPSSVVHSRLSRTVCAMSLSRTTPCAMSPSSVIGFGTGSQLASPELVQLGIIRAWKGEAKVFGGGLHSFRCCVICIADRNGRRLISFCSASTCAFRLAAFSC